jgi:hypothetical protein
LGRALTFAVWVAVLVVIADGLTNLVGKGVAMALPYSSAEGGN